MPSCAAGLRKFRRPDKLNITGSAVTAKNTVTRMRPASAPSSGRFMSLAVNETPLRRSSADDEPVAIGLCFLPML